MTVHIYVDPPYKDSLWCRQTLKGINDEATKKRYAVKMLEAENIYTADLDKFFEDEEQQAIVRESGVRLSVGFDGHRLTDYLPDRVKAACRRIGDMKIKLAFEE